MEYQQFLNFVKKQNLYEKIKEDFIRIKNDEELENLYHYDSKDIFLNLLTDFTKDYNTFREKREFWYDIDELWVINS